jgi:hypothetical protein
MALSPLPLTFGIYICWCPVLWQMVTTWPQAGHSAACGVTVPKAELLAGPGAEREDNPAVRPGRVPVPRRGLRRDLHQLRHARPGPQASTTVPPARSCAGRLGTQRARSRLRTVGRPFSMRTSSEMVGEGRLRTSVRYIGAGGCLPLMWLLYSRAVRIPCGQGLGDGLVRSY